MPVIVILFFAFGIPVLHAQDLILQFTAEEGKLALVVDGKADVYKKILEAIEDGLKTETIFIIQLCEKREGFFSFLGDIVLREITVHYVGYKDFFDDFYILEVDDSGRKILLTETDFLSSFRSLEGIGIDDVVQEVSGERFYLKAMVRIHRVKLIVPLTMIYLISKDVVFESEWVEIGIP